MILKFMKMVERKFRMTPKMTVKVTPQRQKMRPKMQRMILKKQRMTPIIEE